MFSIHAYFTFSVKRKALKSYISPFLILLLLDHIALLVQSHQMNPSIPTSPHPPPCWLPLSPSVSCSQLFPLPGACLSVTFKFLKGCLESKPPMRVSLMNYSTFNIPCQRKTLTQRNASLKTHFQCQASLLFILYLKNFLNLRMAIKEWCLFESDNCVCIS